MAKLKESVIGMLIGQIGQAAGQNGMEFPFLGLNYFVPTGTPKNQPGNDTGTDFFITHIINAN